jgi:hypothetical protein
VPKSSPSNLKIHLRIDRRIALHGASEPQQLLPHAPPSPLSKSWSSPTSGKMCNRLWFLSLRALAAVAINLVRSASLGPIKLRCHFLLDNRQQFALSLCHPN